MVPFLLALSKTDECSERSSCVIRLMVSALSSEASSGMV